MRKLPNDLSQAITVAKYESYKYLRGRKILVFLGLIVLLLVLQTAVPYLLDTTLPQDPKGLAEYYMSLVGTFIIIAATLFAADSLASEYEHRTGFLIFPQPMKRGSLFAGKFLASFLVSMLMVLIYYVVFFIISLYITGTVYLDTFVSLGLAALFVLAATGFGFFVSAFMNRGSTASILVFAALFLIFPIVDSILMFANYDPFFTLSQAGNAVYNAIAGIETYTMDAGMGMTITLYYPETNKSAVVLTVWAIVTTIIAAFRFKSREI
ncbi:MAG TPA: ABC transporter permease [Candidatus Methanomethylophilaceae archaeon]|nr:ABC transporter permease [Candidatus Methanomethylophilaceae archaeon]